MPRKPNTEARVRILNAACKLFHKDGFKGVSMDDIARASKLKKANLFHYYPSKEAMGLAVLEYTTESLRAKNLDQYRDAGDPAKLVEKIFGDSIRRMKENNCCKGCFMGNLAQELSDHSEKLRSKLAEYFEFWSATLAEALERAKSRGSFRKQFNSREAADAILAALEGATLFSKTNRKVASLENARKMVLSYLKSYAA